MDIKRISQVICAARSAHTTIYCVCQAIGKYHKLNELNGYTPYTTCACVYSIYSHISYCSINGSSRNIVKHNFIYLVDTRIEERNVSKTI